MCSSLLARLRSRCVLCASLTAALFTPLAAAQSTYVVGPSGSGIATELCDLLANHTMLIPGGLQPGDEILVRAGNYMGFDLGILQGLTIRYDTTSGMGGAVFDGSSGSCQASVAGRAMLIAGGQDETTVIDGVAGYFEFVGGNVGGGIYIEDSSPQVLNSIIQENAAVAVAPAPARGGGVYITGDPLVTAGPRFFNCKFEGNVADLSDPTGGGGAVFVESGFAEFETCEFLANTSRSEAGAVFILHGTDAGDPTITVTFADCLFADNGSPAGTQPTFGGALLCLGNVVLDMDRCRVVRNGAGQGGGLYVGEGTRLNMDYCVLQDNAAALGGGIKVFDAGLCRLTSTTISNNTATEIGGGAHLEFDENASQEVEFENCLLVENAADIDAGAVFASDTRVSMKKCTVRDNQGGSVGGLRLDLPGETVSEINSCIFWDNTGVAPGGREEISALSGGLTVDYTDWQIGATEAAFVAGTGNVDLDPQFTIGSTLPLVQPDGRHFLNHDPMFTLSPLIDAGDPGPDIMLDGSERTDQGGMPDVNEPDMGFHYDAVPVPPQVSYLTASTSSLTNGGTVTLSLDSGPATSANPRVWFLSGSATGTSPGLPYGQIVIPLVWDFYSTAIASTGGFFIPTYVTVPTGMFTAGKATVTLTVPSGLGLSVDLWHAYFIVETVGGVPVPRDPSNPVKLTLQ
ncbi:MAG: right-handed parallel beta-helix repeat-containing protein [Planctomycetota bacterium]